MPKIRVMPWEERMLRYSIVSISKPKEASMRRRVRSAVLAMSIMLLRSFGHSMKVSLRCLPGISLGQWTRVPETTVTGPTTWVRVCLL